MTPKTTPMYIGIYIYIYQSHGVSGYDNSSMIMDDPFPSSATSTPTCTTLAFLRPTRTTRTLRHRLRVRFARCETKDPRGGFRCLSGAVPHPSGGGGKKGSFKSERFGLSNESLFSSHVRLMFIEATRFEGSWFSCQDNVKLHQ